MAIPEVAMNFLSLLAVMAFSAGTTFAQEVPSSATLRRNVPTPPPQPRSAPKEISLPDQGVEERLKAAVGLIRAQTRAIEELSSRLVALEERVKKIEEKGP